MLPLTMFDVMTNDLKRRILAKGWRMDTARKVFWRVVDRRVPQVVA